jgi:DNA-binding transcriptional LysR family regulator
MDRLDAMSVFVAVVEAGSLSAAGRKLGVPLPTISRKISELEAHIKSRLLTRSTRKLVLTDAGKSYLGACRQILEAVNEAEAVASGEYSAPKGHLIVTAPIVFGRLHVLPVTNEFLQAYPEVDVQLVLGDSTLNLLEEHIDVAVRIGVLADSSHIATRVALIRQVVCASPMYFEMHGVPRTPDELRGHDCISCTGVSSPDVWTFGAGRSRLEVPVHSRLTVNTVEAAIDAAIAGVGITSVLSYQIEAAIRSGKLDIILQEFESASIPVSLIYTGQRLLPKKLRAFLDFATPRLCSRLTAVTD